MTAPLTDLVGEIGETKVTRATSTKKKKKWHWAQVHQDAFDLVKHTLAEEVIPAYPNYGWVFEIYTDASQHQLGAVIVQDGRPLSSLLLA